MKYFPRSFQYLLWILGIALIGFLVMDLSSRMSELRRLRSLASQVDEKNTRLMKTVTHLETEIAYAESDESVEEWAYEQGRMIQRGDMPVVILPSGEQEEVASDEVAPEHAGITPWQVWKALFFEDGIP